MHHNPNYESNINEIINDIALLKLSSKVQFSSWIQPACLTTDYSFQTGNTVFYAQWESDSKLIYYTGKVADCEYPIRKDLFCVHFKLPKDFQVHYGSPIFKKTTMGDVPSWTVLGINSEKRLKGSSQEEGLHVFRATSVQFQIEWITNHVTGVPSASCGMNANVSYNIDIHHKSKTATPGGYPFMSILINKENGELTQGALLNEQWVVTVAHFFLSSLKKHVIVFIGMSNLLHYTTTEETFRREILILKIKSSFSENHVDDLALIKLDEPVSISEKIQPICLKPISGFSEMPGNAIRLVGWGLKTGGIFSDALTEIYIPRGYQGACRESELSPLRCFGPESNSEQVEPFIGGSGALLFYRLQLTEDSFPVRGWTLVGLTSKLRQQNGQFELPLKAINMVIDQKWIEEHLYESPGKGAMCGQTFSTSHPSEIHGIPTKGSFPFVALIMKSSQPICEGTIIEKEWILATAHCIRDFFRDQREFTNIVLGAYNLKDLDNEGFSVKVKYIYIHPQYDETKRWRDIGLIRLEKPISYTEAIQPACLPLPSRKILYGEELYILGWNLTHGNASSPEMLQSRLVLHGCHNCTDIIEGSAETCVGEEGGPIFKRNVKKMYPSVIISWTVTGIISESTGCSRLLGDPPVHVKITRIVPVVEWINRRIYNIANETVRCGLDFLDTSMPYLFQGNESAAGQFPFVAFVMKSEGGFCGGTLFHQEWILTSAGCVIKRKVEDVKVILGHNIVTNDIPKEDLRSISGIYVHPDFTEGTINNDIALIRIKSAVKFSKLIQPICLPEKNWFFPLDLSVDIAGWGYHKDTEKPLDGVSSPHHLRNRKVLAMNFHECKNKEHDHEKTICLWDRQYGRHPCLGDLGGPAAIKIEVKDTKLWTLIGILGGNAASCEFSNDPFLAARVNKYINWIHTVKEGFFTNLFPGLCGQYARADATSFITSGTETLKGRYPFMAVIVAESESRCGGALIHSQWIVSSSACIYSITRFYVTLTGRVGVYKINSWEEEYQERRIIEIYLGQKHKAPDKENSMALLKLATPVYYNRWVQPICLERDSYGGIEGQIIGKSFKILGWTDVNKSETLLESKSEVVSLKECGANEDSTSLFCLKNSLPETHYHCKGDYGGPVFSKEILSESPLVYGWVLIGVLSGPHECDENSETIGLAVRVKEYERWINEIMTTAPIKQCGVISAIQKGVADIRHSVTEEIIPNSLPFMALIEDRNSYVGGVIIHERWVLTVANFFIDVDRNKTIVRLGIHNLKRLEDGAFFNYILSVFMETGDNAKLAMVKLVKPITYTNKIQPVCLPVRYEYARNISDVHVAGWNTLMINDERYWSGNVLFERRLLPEDCENLLTHPESFQCYINYQQSKPPGERPQSAYDPLCNFNGKAVFTEVRVSDNPIIYGWTVFGLMEGSPGDCLSTSHSRTIYKIEYRLKWIFSQLHEDPEFPEQCGMNYVEEMHKTDFSNIGLSVAGRTPFVVSIRRGSEHACSGALLENGWVITIVTCVLYQGFIPVKEVTVVFGVSDLKDPDSRYIEDVDSENIYISPLSANEDELPQSIIVLLKTRFSKLTKLIQPICLPWKTLTSVHVSDNTTFYCAGWGKINNIKSSSVIQMEVKEIPEVVMHPGVRSFTVHPSYNATSVSNIFFEPGSPLFAKGISANNPTQIVWKLIGIVHHTYTSEYFDGPYVIVIAAKNLSLTNKDWMEHIMMKNILPKDDCGIPLVDVETNNAPAKLVFGGSESKTGNWPWMAIISLKNTSPLCGGSLISASVVLTAASCVRGMAHEKLFVGIGKEDTSDVLKIMIHPQFRVPAFENNIAVLKLSNSLEVQPICLPEKHFPVGVDDTMYIAGFGQFRRHPGYRSILRHAKVKLLKWRSCQEKTNKMFPLTPKTVCATSQTADACAVDDGGPMAVKVRRNATHNSWVLYGIITRHSPNCGKIIHPIVGTKVSEFYDWIQEHLIK